MVDVPFRYTSQVLLLSGLWREATTLARDRQPILRCLWIIDLPTPPDLRLFFFSTARQIYGEGFSSLISPNILPNDKRKTISSIVQ